MVGLYVARTLPSILEDTVLSDNVKVSRFLDELTPLSLA